MGDNVFRPRLRNDVLAPLASAGKVCAGHGSSLHREAEPP